MEFIIGCLVGSFVGVFALALCKASSDADDAMERYEK